MALLLSEPLLLLQPLVGELRLAHALIYLGCPCSDDLLEERRDRLEQGVPLRVLINDQLLPPGQPLEHKTRYILLSLESGAAKVALDELDAGYDQLEVSIAISAGVLLGLS